MAARRTQAKTLTNLDNLLNFSTFMRCVILQPNGVFVTAGGVNFLWISWFGFTVNHEGQFSISPCLALLWALVNTDVKAFSEACQHLPGGGLPALLTLAAIFLSAS